MRIQTIYIISKGAFNTLLIKTTIGYLVLMAASETIPSSSSQRRRGSPNSP